MKTNQSTMSTCTLKAFVLFFILHSSFFISFGQAPEKISYQAVIRNAGNELVSNQQVGMKISILQESESGTVVYAETHTPTTNANGLVSVIVGNGTVVEGDISTINWGTGTYFLKSETDVTGGTAYSITIINQILSVPYALHAKMAESFTEIDPVFSAWDKNYNDLTNVPQVFPPVSHTHSADDISSGVLNISRIPTGTTSSTVALGNHTHSGMSMPIGEKGQVLLYDGSEWVGRNFLHWDFDNMRFGVGTTTPTQFFDIAGQIRIRGGEPNIGKVLTSDSEGNASWQYMSGGGSSNWILNGNNLFNNNIAGKVGIGTSNPNAKLTIFGNYNHPLIPGIESNGILRIATASNDAVDFGKIIDSPYSAWLQSGYNSSIPDPFSINPLGGNVGIGTIDPTQSLDINGKIRIRGGNPGAGKVLICLDDEGNAVWSEIIMACPDGYTTCSGICVDTKTDLNNCGSCGNKCPTGQICVNGVCIYSCPPGQTLCSGQCVDTTSDQNNCGSCGNKCTGSKMCSSSKCVCPTGLTDCSGTCVNTQNDINNCGNCGTKCPSGYICSNGMCVLSCPPGQTACSGQCVDTTSDQNNCGSCGNKCTGGKMCSSSKCVCPTGQTDCSGICRNLQTDANNCGACGKVCATGQTCCSGICRNLQTDANNCGACGKVCATGQTCCSGICRNLQTDANNCGACGKVCATGQTCCSGICRNLQTDANNCGACGKVCASGQTCCSGICRNLNTDPNNCGACGYICPPGKTCVNGVCVY